MFVKKPIGGNMRTITIDITAMASVIPERSVFSKIPHSP
jgi:hypothetical protein